VESDESWGAGWIAFAGIILVIVGVIDVIWGLLAIIEDEYVKATPEGLAIIDVTAWGWLTLLWGCLLALAGFALFGGAGWARWFAIFGASIGAIGQMAYMANYPQAYPLWNITVLTLQIVVIYALVVKWQGFKAAVRG
jgi:hypothetical protein